METISIQSRLGQAQTQDDLLAEVTVRFHRSSAPGRVIGGYTITQTVDAALARGAGSEVSWVRHAISALLDELQGGTIRVQPEDGEGQDRR